MTSKRPVRNDAGEVRAYVRLTDPAVAHLERLDGSALVWALKKMLLLERNPYAGRSLVGDLSGYRKLTVGNRDWRIIWKPIKDKHGVTVIEVAEIWAVGARADSAVYAEMRERVATLSDSPRTRRLSEIVGKLGMFQRVAAAEEPPAKDPLPEWLIAKLVDEARLRREDVEQLSLQAAFDAWTQFLTNR